MINYVDEKEETPAGRPVSEGCEGISHYQTEAKAEEEIPEEMIDAGVKILLGYFPDQPADWFVRDAVQEILCLLPRRDQN